MRTFTLSFLLLLGMSFSAASQSLEDYFLVAAENNPGLQAKYKAFEAAMEKISQVGSLQDLNLSFGYFVSPVETRVGPQQARFSLTQMFPWFGTLRAQEDVASLMAEAKYQEFLDAKNQLYNQLAAVYYPLLETHELIAIEEENLRILETYYSLATSKFENGQGSLADALRVDIMIQASKTNVEVLKMKIKGSNSWLNSLLARSHDSPVEISEKLEIWDADEMLSPDSIQTNPLLESIDLKIQASEASVLVAQKQGMPKLGAGVDYVLVGERTDVVMADNGKNVLMPMITMSLPIFRAKYKGAQKEAELMQESYKLEMAELSNKLYGSYYRYSSDMQIQKDLISLYGKQVVTSEQTLELLYNGYSNSGKDFEEVLRVQQQLLEFQKMKLKAIVTYKTSLAQINYLTAKTY
ncbi:Outer membrane protein TolC [Algoriphagus locisalis]|uniref:Outer membrane protein TolC n=1 Tax=Algoriphagus locisalis TaxID=305507 RepID=A0A1I7A7C4_9BACT|nr:TolC family protein [Algoriphagus locisalis]SFT70843.1 Outer membrane protein TolC [Algoriphagus locisalis]